MQAEGVSFQPNTHVGVDLPVRRLLDEFDAVVLSGGSEHPRDLPIPGRELEGIHFAMDFLRQQNQRSHRVVIPTDQEITATGKHVLVIGGGDTGSDCVGTSRRQGALSVTQFEIMPKPPEREDKLLTWPNWPLKLRTSTSHEEGCERDWSVLSKRFVGADGQVAGLAAARVEWHQENGRWVMRDMSGSEFEIQADLVLLAMGFVHPVHEGLLHELGVALDEHGNVRAQTSNYKTSIDKAFSAGDMRRGQSLVVWAIREGRQCARAVDQYLMGSSDLPR
jgi:glutamate synthase (NADPH/NADH) small chain